MFHKIEYRAAITTSMVKNIQRHKLLHEIKGKLENIGMRVHTGEKENKKSKMLTQMIGLWVI